MYQSNFFPFHEIKYSDWLNFLCIMCYALCKSLCSSLYTVSFVYVENLSTLENLKISISGNTAPEYTALDRLKS